MKNKTVIFLFIILVIAAFFRLWQLDLIPPGLYPDVAINGNDALDSLKSGSFKVFYPENNGREGLMMWLIALSFSIFGVSIWSIKIVAAIIGILTVLGLYLLTKELFNQLGNCSRTIALFSSFFLATSFWHVIFSRIGFRAILLPFILVFAFYFLLKGFRTQKLSNFIIAGVFLGLGFYTYISYRFIVILLPLVLLYWFLIYLKEKQTKKFFLFTVYCLLFTVIVALPIGLYFLQNPHDFVGRATGVSVFAQENPIKTLGESLILHLGMFNFYGDANWRHNFAGSPMLFWPVGILFLVGFFISVRETIKSIREKNYPPYIAYHTLIFWFFVMLLPGVLTYEGIPHALRTIGVIPVVYIFIGLGGWKVYEFLNKNTTKKTLLSLASFLFLLAVGVSEFNKYFVKWGHNLEVKGAFSEDYVKIGNYLNSLPPEIQKYVIVNQPGVPVPFPDGLPMPAQTPMFIESTKYREPRSIYLLPENLEQIKMERETMIVPMKYNEDLFKTLRQKFPQGEIQKKDEVSIYEIK